MIDDVSQRMPHQSSFIEDLFVKAQSLIFELILVFYAFFDLGHQLMIIFSFKGYRNYIECLLYSIEALILIRMRPLNFGLIFCHHGFSVQLKGILKLIDFFEES